MLDHSVQLLDVFSVLLFYFLLTVQNLHAPHTNLSILFTFCWHFIWRLHSGWRILSKFLWSRLSLTCCKCFSSSSCSLSFLVCLVICASLSFSLTRSFFIMLECCNCCLDSFSPNQTRKSRKINRYRISSKVTKVGYCLNFIDVDSAYRFLFHNLSKTFRY